MRESILPLMLAAFIWCDGAPAQSANRIAHPKVLIMEATAFARAPQPTAAGTEAHDGIVAADPRILPLGTRIRIMGTASYDGYYLVTDTGAAVKGMHVDIYVPSIAQAKRFGTKRVRVEVIRIGKGPADARRKDGGTPGGFRNQ